MHLVWFDIDLETIEDDEVWKPESVRWALTVDWAKVNDLVRHHLEDFPTGDFGAALRSADAATELTETDRAGLFSLYAEPIYATPHQITAGGHRITAMRAQGIRWALGQCLLDDIGDSVDVLHAYLH